MTVITRPILAPPLRAAWLLLIALLVMALAAGGAIVGSRLLTSNGVKDGLLAPTMIPQGDEAVFALATWVGGAGGQTDGDIHTVRADGTDMRQLTGGPGIDEYPTWSPDGTRIAFRARQAGTDSLVTIDGGGGGMTTLASNAQSPSCAERWSVAWSPDGKSLVFPVRDGCGAYDLYIVPADGSSPPARLLAPGTNSLYAAWSPDGSTIAFIGSEASGSTGLYVADVGPEGALAGRLQARRIGPDVGTNLADGPLGPQWSPDGSELAVGVETRDAIGDAAAAVYIVKADGSGQRLLAERAVNPQWSPDGQQLAFHRVVDPAEYVNNRPCTVRTWIIDADGANERRLEELGDGCGTPPRWSPDGTRLANVLISANPDAPFGADFRLGFVMVDGSSPPVALGDAFGTWQPVAAPLPQAPSFESAAPAG